MEATEGLSPPNASPPVRGCLSCHLVLLAQVMTWICVCGHAHGTPMLVLQHKALGADFAAVMRDQFSKVQPYRDYFRVRWLDFELAPRPDPARLGPS